MCLIQRRDACANFLKSFLSFILTFSVFRERKTLKKNILKKTRILHRLILYNIFFKAFLMMRRMWTEDMENIYNAIYEVIIERVNSNFDVKAKLKGELIKLLDQAHFIAYLRQTCFYEDEYNQVMKLLGFTNKRTNKKTIE